MPSIYLSNLLAWGRWHKLSIGNKCLDAVILSYILHENQSNKKFLHILRIRLFKLSRINILYYKCSITYACCRITTLTNTSLNFTCASSPFIYYQVGHVITGDLNIYNNVFPKGRKYCESKSINLKSNIKLIMDYVDDFARRETWKRRLILINRTCLTLLHKKECQKQLYISCPKILERHIYLILLKKK